MLRAHLVEDVRRAEAAAMARLPEGALMQRAAAGLAAAVLDLLGGGYGRRVLLLVGPGDNGGDALWAGSEGQVTALAGAPGGDLWLATSNPSRLYRVRVGGGEGTAISPALASEISTRLRPS